MIFQVQEVINYENEFISLVAAMLIEGDCEEHKHNLDTCRDRPAEQTEAETGEPECCNENCTAYAPSGSDQDVDALYELIAAARLAVFEGRQGKMKAATHLV